MNKEVRHDVRVKLNDGLIRARMAAINTGASLPKRWGYSTPKANHWVVYIPEEERIYYHTKGYTGVHYISIRPVFKCE